jgi:hypothetical protein
MAENNDRKMWWYDIRQKLQEPFRLDELQFRVLAAFPKNSPTAARISSYIDARTVFDRLDAVVGAGGWQVDHDASGGQVITALELWDPFLERWIRKEDGGFIGGQDDVASTKGTLSDGVKRAAVAWGIFRYGAWLPLFIIPWAPDRKYLYRSELGWMRARIPEWAKPGGTGRPNGDALDVLDLRKEGPDNRKPEPPSGPMEPEIERVVDRETGEIISAQPAPPPAANGRPYAPEVVVDRLIELALDFEKALLGGGHKDDLERIDNIRGAVRGNLELAFAGDDHSADKVHSFLAAVWGPHTTSTTQLGPAKLMAHRKHLNWSQDAGGQWTPDPMSMQEIQAVVRARMEEQHAGSLFPEANDGRL